MEMTDLECSIRKTLSEWLLSSMTLNAATKAVMKEIQDHLDGLEAVHVNLVNESVADMRKKYEEQLKR